MEERLKSLLQERGITPYKIQKDLGICEGTVRGWFKGKIPRGDHLLKISDYLGVDPHYLLSGEKQYEPQLSQQAEKLAEEFAQYGTDGIRFGRESLRLLRTTKEDLTGKSKTARRKAG